MYPFEREEDAGDRERLGRSVEATGGLTKRGVGIRLFSLVCLILFIRQT